MPDDTVTLLPPIKSEKPRKGLSYLKPHLHKPTKPKFSVVNAKKAVKLFEKTGKIVTGMYVAPDGGFTINATDQATAAKSTKNPWDEVLSHD